MKKKSETKKKKTTVRKSRLLSAKSRPRHKNKIDEADSPVLRLRSEIQELRARLAEAEEALRRDREELEYKVARRTEELKTHQIELEMQNLELRAAQEELESSRSKFADLYDLAPIGYFSLDRQGIIKEVNRAGAELLGAGRHGLLEKPFSCFIGDNDDRTVFFSHRKEAFASRFRVNCDIRLRRADGTLFYAQLQSIAVENASEEPDHIRTTVIDITDRKQVEDALRESEERYRTLFRAMNEGFAICEIILDGNGKAYDYRHLMVNPAFERLTGYSIESAGGRTAREVIPSVEQYWVDLFGRAAISGEAGAHEGYVQGLGKWFSARAFGLGQGKFAYIFQDITERKLAEGALKKSVTRFELLAGTAAELLQRGEPQKVMESVFKKAMAHLGCDVFFNFLADEKAGKLRLNSYAGISEEEARKIECLDPGEAISGRVARDGCRIIAEHIPTTPDVQTSLIQSFGVTAYACHPLLTTKGRVMGTLSFGTRTRQTFNGRDIDLMKAVADQVASAMVRISNEAALRESEERYRLLIEVSPDAIMTHDGSVFLFANGAAAHLLGFNSPDELAGRDIFSILHPDFHQIVRERIVAMKASARTVPRELKILRSDGTILDVESVGAPMVLDGRQVFQIILRDIAEHKQAEAALRQSNAAVRDILESISDGFMAVDREWRFRYLNKRAAENVGFSPEELIGCNIWEKFPNLAGTDHEKHYLRAMTNRSVENFELKGVLTDKSYAISVYPTLDGIAVYWLDITERKRMEEALRESEGRLRTLSLATFEGIVISEGGHVVEANEQFASMHGFSTVEVLGKQLTDFVAPEERENLLKAVRSGAERISEYRAIKKDGSSFFVEVHGKTVEEAGRSLRVSAIRDVTERKLTEEALHKNEERLREYVKLLEYAPVMVRNMDDEIILWNSGMERMYHYPPAEAIGRKAYDLLRTVFPQSREHIRDTLNRAGRWEGDLEHVAGDGRKIIVTSLWVLHKNLQGEATAIIEIDSNITERRRAEEALLRLNEELEARVRERTEDLAKTINSLKTEMASRMKAEEQVTRLATAIESAADALVVTDPVKGIIEYVNPAFEKITGYSREEVLGRDLHMLESGRQGEEFFRELRESLRENGVWTGRMVHKKKDGSLYEEECTYSPVKNSSGEIINYISIKRDVTEKVRLESIAQAVETMNNVGYIFAGVSHEVGNPVNAIGMNLNIIKKKLDQSPLEKENISEYVERAEGQLARVRYLLASLKNFNMYENLQLQAVDSASFLEIFLPMVKKDFEAKGITVECRLAPDCRPLYADPRALQQVLLNIMTNASDALEGRQDSKIVITVSSSADFIKICVTDNGRGIEEARMKDLFKPFYTTKKHGTGLGLVIIKKMIARMNGTVEVTSRINEGTSVELCLPYEKNGNA